MIELYIDNQLVDIDDKVNISINKTVTSINDPASIKNSWSQTLNIIGTDTNNKIFGNIYDLSRTTPTGSTSQSGYYFNSSKRTPFKLFVDGTIYFEGYIKLKQITVKSNINTYSVTLFGELGNWLQSLREKKLSDLDLDLEHMINRDTIISGITYTPTYGGNNLFDKMCYPMCWNGTYNDFDNKKVQIDSSTVVINSFERDEYDFDTYECDRLMSYKQRPGVFVHQIMNKILESIPSNYTVDSDFLVSGNTYYKDLIYLVKQYGLKTKSDKNVNYEYALFSQTTDAFLSSGHPIRSGVDNTVIDGVYEPTKQNGLLLSFGDKATTLCWSKNSSDLNILNKNANTINVDINANANFRFLVGGADVATRSKVFEYNGYVMWDTPITGICRMYSIQTDINIKTKTVSIYDYRYDDIIFTLPNNSYSYSISKNAGSAQFNNMTITYKDINGNKTTYPNLAFSQNSSVATFLFETESGVTDTITSEGNGAYKFYCQFIFPAMYGTGALAMNDGLSHLISIKSLPTNHIILSAKNSRILSNTIVNQEDILPSDVTQLDFLTSYFKLFGLLVEDDYLNGKFNIYTKSKFYGDEVIKDFTEYVDRTEGFVITPNTFDSKYLVLNYKSNTGNEYDTIYNNYYGEKYGEKILDTGLDFNTKLTNIFSKNIFLPTILSQEFLSINKTDAVQPGGLDVQLPIGYVPQSLPAFFKRDGIIKKPISNFGSLIFNRPTDRMKTYQSDINGIGYGGYKITDVTPKMIIDNVFCYNLSTINVSDKQTQYPYYSVIDETNSYSCDLFKPNEIYNKNSYPDNIDIYSKYWKNYLTDRYNVDSKILECTVILSDYEKNNLKLSDFIMIDNILYSIDKLTTNLNNNIVKLELVTVKNIKNYTT